jgi:uncharacterized protein YceK
MFVYLQYRNLKQIVMKRSNFILLMVLLMFACAALSSCSTCHSRRKAQNKKWYVQNYNQKFIKHKQIVLV